MTRWQNEPELVEVEQPHAGPGQVVIKVGGAGACHSDVHIIHGPGAPWPIPFTLGHENAGWVHEVGSGVTSFEVGQAVAVHGPWGCGGCSRCAVGADNSCEGPGSGRASVQGGGLGADGGMAEYLLVPDARHLVPLPDGLSPAEAAPLTDAGLTPYHAVRRSFGKLLPGSTAVVIGVGGLGHMAVQILRATTAARIIAVDTKESALSLATSLGADVALLADDRVADEIRRATGGRGADVVLDFVGVGSTLAAAAASARTLGDVTLVGIGGGSIPFSFFTVPLEVSLQSVYWGTRPELVEVLDLAARGLVRAEVTTYPLEAAPEVYRALAAGAISGRAVITPHGGPQGR